MPRGLGGTAGFFTVEAGLVVGWRTSSELESLPPAKKIPVFVYSEGSINIRENILLAQKIIGLNSYVLLLHTYILGA